jgi:hypothetical protein
MRIVLHDESLEPITVLALPIEQYTTLNEKGVLACTIDKDIQRMFVIKTLPIDAPNGFKTNIYYTNNEISALTAMPAILPGQQHLLNHLIERAG